MTHAELVTRAARWLTNTRKCTVVLTECGATCGNEIPDAIGWTPRGQCIVVECKVSVADFLRDKHKVSNRSGRKCGALRYYMVPRGLLGAERVRGVWGLLEASETQVRVLKHAEPTVGDAAAESQILVSELRRVSLGLRDGSGRVGVFLENQ